MSDIDKAMQFMAIQQRHAQAMMKILPGTASQQVVAELKTIYAEYEALFESGPPDFEFYTLDDVRSNMADVLEMIARTYDSLRDEDRAIEYYEKAAVSFDAINQPEKAARCRENIDKIRGSEGGTIDEELQRLLAKQSSLELGSLPYITTLIEIGELRMKGGDDFAAEKDLREALTQLEAISSPDPQGEKARKTLLKAVGAVTSGDMSELAEIEELVATRGLYQRIYHSMALIYQETDQLDEAAKWLEKYEQLTAGDTSDVDILSLLSSLADQSEDV